MKRELTIIMSLILGVMVLFSFKNKKTRSVSAPIVLDDRDKIQRKVTEQITFAEKSQDLHEMAESSRQVLDLSSLSPAAKRISPMPKVTPIDLRGDSNEMTAYNDLKRDRKTVDYTQPSFIIQNQIAEKYEAMKLRNAYNEAFIEAFLSNARAQGYDVKLDAQNRVISVKQIRKPDSLTDSSHSLELESNERPRSEKIQTAK